MPRYFFHIHDGLDHWDNEGVFLPDIERAKLKAVRIVLQVLHDDIELRRCAAPWRLEIANDAGKSLVEFCLLAEGEYNARVFTLQVTRSAGLVN